MSCWSSPKELATLRPGDTSAAALFTGASDMAYLLDSVFVTNLSGSPVTFRLFVDRGGGYVEAEAYYYDKTVPANDALKLELGVPLGEAENLGVRSGSASDLRFAVIGRQRKA